MCHKNCRSLKKKSENTVIKSLKFFFMVKWRSFYFTVDMNLSCRRTCFNEASLAYRKISVSRNVVIYIFFYSRITVLYISVVCILYRLQESARACIRNVSSLIPAVIEFLPKRYCKKYYETWKIQNQLLVIIFFKSLYNFIIKSVCRIVLRPV